MNWKAYRAGLAASLVAPAGQAWGGSAGFQHPREILHPLLPSRHLSSRCFKDAVLAKQGLSAGRIRKLAVGWGLCFGPSSGAVTGSPEAFLPALLPGTRHPCRQLLIPEAYVWWSHFPAETQCSLLPGLQPEHRASSAITPCPVGPGLRPHCSGDCVCFPQHFSLKVS